MISFYLNPDANRKMTTRESEIYVATCVDGCFYIGTTTNRSQREAAHRNLRGSEWTKIHQVYSFEYFEGGPEQEDAMVVKYAAQYGIDRVRGGTYSQPTLPGYLEKALEAMIKTYKGTCFICGQTGHFASFHRKRGVYLPADMKKALNLEDKTPVSTTKKAEVKDEGLVIDPNYFDSSKEWEVIDKPIHEGFSVICFYCKIPGHTVNECRKKAAETGSALRCNYCKKYGHTYNQCFTRMNHQKRLEDDIAECYECGKLGHDEEDCPNKPPCVIM